MYQDFKIPFPRLGSWLDFKVLRRILAAQTAEAPTVSIQNLLQGRSDLAHSLRVQNKVHEAEVNFRLVYESLALREGASSPNALAAASNLASVLHEAGRRQEATELFELATDGLKRTRFLPDAWSGPSKLQSGASELRRLEAECRRQACCSRAVRGADCEVLREFQEIGRSRSTPPADLRGDEAEVESSQSSRYLLRARRPKARDLRTSLKVSRWSLTRRLQSPLVRNGQVL
eukprot:s2128_g1.t2